MSLQTPNSLLLSQVVERLQGLTGSDFQSLIVDHLKCRSAEFLTIERGPIQGPDGGVDITATIRTPTEAIERIIFECKNKDEAVGINVVKILQSTMVTKKAHQAVIVSPRDLSQPARDQIHSLESQPILINYKEWTGHGLAETLLTKSPALVAERFPDLLQYVPLLASCGLTPALEELVSLETIHPSESADMFYDGFVPTWNDLKAGFDMPRQLHFEDKEMKQFMQSASTNELHFLTHLSLLGVAGSGKSTQLRRLAFDSVGEGWRVLRLRDDWQVFGANIYEEINHYRSQTSGRVLVVIDDAASFFKVHPLTSDVIAAFRQSSPSRVILLTAEEPQIWAQIERTGIVRHPVYKYVCIYMSHLTDVECEQLVDRIIFLEERSQLSRKLTNPTSREQRLALCKTRAQRQLLVAMLQMRHGQRFIEIIQREYARLSESPRVQEAYAVTSYAQAFDIGMPAQLLRKIIGLVNLAEISAFNKNTEKLIVQTQSGVCARHRRIAREVANHVFDTAELRAIVLTRIVDCLDGSYLDQSNILKEIFSAKGRHKRLLREFDWSRDLTDQFYVGALNSHHRGNSYFERYIYSSYGMALRTLNDPMAASQAFKSSTICDPTYGFPLRQWAWSEHFQGRFAAAAQLAMQAANLDEESFSAQIQCAKMLSLNTLDNFSLAGDYFERALVIEPHNIDAVESRDEWKLVKDQILPVLRDLVSNELLPSFVTDNLRPNLSFLRSTLGPKNGKVKESLRRRLFYWQEDVNVDEGAVLEAVGDIQIGKDKNLRALLNCNIARSRYVAWYQERISINTKGIEALFLESIALDSKNPFSYCWYGTFLKEVKEDFSGADRQYRMALMKANSHKNPRLHNHPLILNNMALLLIDKYLREPMNADYLEQARRHLELAVQRVKEIESRFRWPEHSLAECNHLLYGHGLKKKAVAN